MDEIDEILSRIGNQKRYLIRFLQEIQAKYNYLPEESLRKLSEKTGIRPCEIEGVASFYPQFRRRPAGKYSIKVCIGTACHVKGAQNIFDTFKKQLGINEKDDTDSKRLFTIEKVACLGCCMLAPAVQIDDLTYGHVYPKKIPSVLRDFLSSKEEDLFLGKLYSVPEPAGEARICLCSSCSAAGAKKVYHNLADEIKSSGLKCKLKTTACTGISFEAPIVEIKMANNNGTYRYGYVRPENARWILFKHFKPEKTLKKISSRFSMFLENILTGADAVELTRYSPNLRKIHSDKSYDFTAKQKHIVMSGAGHMDPLDIDDYIKHGGFSAAEMALKNMSPEQIVHEIECSGLRGRGGAGYPTGKKWANVAKYNSKIKYIICNGDEGDPGAFMNRIILESFPFRVLEGIIIASKAVGAQEGFMYIRAEYPLALERINEAIKICESRNLLGENIIDSGHKFHLELVFGAGAFVCGEETALIAALEGRRAMPRYRPPFPSESGLWNCPTLINNVETFASVPSIIKFGSNYFSSIGTEKSKGTKTFALAGKVKRGGLIEIPMGTTLREIVEKIGGGIPDNKKIKAIQIGGPSGGTVPASLLDTPVDYEQLISAGSMMGSGGIVVLDENDCMVDIAKFFISFTQIESCGKCTFCRIGTKIMLDTLNRICDGKGQEEDIDKLMTLAKKIKKGSLCGFGKTAPNPLISTITYFRDEYIAHIKGYCPAGKCKNLIQYKITAECIGCGLCARNCCASAISFRPYKKHEIDSSRCVKCGNCISVCPVKAVTLKKTAN